MKITTALIDQTYFQDGLPTHRLGGLGRVVVLAGPNGSGKSRLLNRVLNTNRQICEHAKEQMGFHFDGVCPGENVTVASYSCRAFGVIDPENNNLNQLRAAASQAQSLGMQNVGGNSPSYVKTLQDRRWNVTHPDFKGDSGTRDEVVRNYDQLRDLLTSLIGVGLGRNVNGQATLYESPIAQAALSEGQQALLTWAVTLHAQGVQLGRVVLVIDEPENHLHPDAALRVVCRAIDATPNGQVWVGTHSVPLLAGLVSRYRDDVSTFFMDAGKATFAGKEPEKVVLSLMGGEDNVQAVREFLDLPEVLAANRFAAECLRPPPVVSGAVVNDPQVVAVDVCLPRHADRLPKVLDFGAGDGRLVESLAARHGPLDELLTYVAWDVPESKGDRCEVALRRAYRNAGCGRFTLRYELFAVHSPGTFDAVVMCNVLHEIDPSDWPAQFDSHGVVYQALADDGKLIIVEDYLMPKGEHAHRYGFIVLDTEPLRALFAVGSDEIQVAKADGRYRDRIRAHVIPKRLLSNVTKITRQKALELAQRNAREEIRRLRTSGTLDFRSGQAHAFWVQQFANTSLALNDL